MSCIDTCKRLPFFVWGKKINSRGDQKGFFFEKKLMDSQGISLYKHWVSCLAYYFQKQTHIHKLELSAV